MRAPRNNVIAQIYLRNFTYAAAIYLVGKSLSLNGADLPHTRSRIPPTIDGVRKLIAFGRLHDSIGMMMMGGDSFPEESPDRVVQKDAPDGRALGLVAMLFFKPTDHEGSITTPKASSATTDGSVGSPCRFRYIRPSKMSAAARFPAPSKNSEIIER